MHHLVCYFVPFFVCVLCLGLNSPDYIHRYFLSYDFLNILSYIYEKFKLIIFRFFMIFSRIKIGAYLGLLEHAITRKHVYEHSCSFVRVFLSILAHLADIAQSFFSDFKRDK